MGKSANSAVNKGAQKKVQTFKVTSNTYTSRVETTFKVQGELTPDEVTEVTELIGKYLEGINGN